MDNSTKVAHIAFKRKESISEPLLLNFLIATLSERGFDVVMVADDYVESVAPIWFNKFSKGGNKLSFISLDDAEKNKGTYFVHNYDEVLPKLTNSKVVQINASNPEHVSISCDSGYVDFCGYEVFKALVEGKA